MTKPTDPSSLSFPDPRPRRWWLVAAITAAVLAVAAIIGWITVGSSKEPKPTVRPTTAEPAASTRSQGGIPYEVLEVGTDIAAGIYKTSAQPQSSGIDTCFWERNDDASGSVDSVLASGVVTRQAVVEVTATDHQLRSYGCAPWTPIGNEQLMQSFGSDAVLVGSQVAPGTYVAATPGADCYWERAKDALNQPESVLQSGTSYEGKSVQVQIMAGDFLFNSYGCGQWERAA